jgi:hypothetical protein
VNPAVPLADAFGSARPSTCARCGVHARVVPYRFPDVDVDPNLSPPVCARCHPAWHLPSRTLTPYPGEARGTYVDDGGRLRPVVII